ncbi:replication protein a 70 kda DNA-binding subunit a [Anaeramoeba ignava]|uniref:Replication protein a 70 kDa DNA-binding subunit a n=1 Tax=Anaeramoeba ignava TaxID=1746090 RepID=A0A9Q0LC18_ANAIG|nr:replication protein a 70 kda DNA-binding subunit a [Anaeramoeba ignava]
MFYNKKFSFKKSQSNSSVEIPISKIEPNKKGQLIKARIIWKSDLKKLSSEKFMLKIRLIDFEGTEIQAIAFEKIAENLSEQLIIGKVYLIFDFLPQKKYYTNDDSMELKFNEYTSFELCQDDNTIPQLKFTPIQISTIVSSSQKKDIVNTIGIIDSVSNPISLLSRNSQQHTKLSLKIYDKNSSIEVAFME